MPSPFPGMDPYLEWYAVWPGVHANLIIEMQAAINRAPDLDISLRSNSVCMTSMRTMPPDIIAADLCRRLNHHAPLGPKNSSQGRPYFTRRRNHARM